jgi:ubiquitin C-terminal hydrolase
MPTSPTNLQQHRHIEFVYPRNLLVGTSSVKEFSFRSDRVNKQAESNVTAGDCDLQPQDIDTLYTSLTIDDILNRKHKDDLKKKDKESQKSLGVGKLTGFSVQDALQDKTGCRPRANSTDTELNLPRRGLCDEGLVLESHNWMDWRPCIPKGLVNLGNTCFLNATLQCLAYLPPFCQCLIMLDVPSSGKLCPGQRITSHMRQLFKKVHGLELHDDNASANKSNKTVVTPQQIVRDVPTLGSIGSRNGYKFRPGRQEDAHEFLVYLLDAMHDGELKAAGINQHVRGWRDQLPIPRLDETTFIHRVFGGYLRSQVCCTNCDHRSNTYDPFLDLALEVSKKSSTCLASAFQEFFRRETLDKNNRWRCSGCKKNVCATKQLTVFRPPLSLCIQLKRFTFFNSHGFGNHHGYPNGMRFYGAGGGSKINKAIEFPARFKLPLSDGRRCEYELTGVIVHLGSHANSGHYTAYVKSPSKEGSVAWFHMDDSYVEAVSEKTVLRQKDAYILFYCRTEVKLVLPSPPLQVPGKKSDNHIDSSPQTLPKATPNTKLDSDSGNAEQESRKPPQVNSNSVIASTAQTLPKKVETPNTILNSDSGNAEQEYRKPLQVNSNSVIASTAQTLPKKMKTPNTKSDSDSENAEQVPMKPPQMNSNSVIASTAQNSVNEVKSSIEKTNDVGLDGMTLETTESKSDVETLQLETEIETKKTRVVLHNRTLAGKVELMVGRRCKTKKAWNPKALTTLTKDESFDLLGSDKTLKWDDHDVSQHISVHRKKIVTELGDDERHRKRKMNASRWDAFLDQGKVKKVKSKQGHENYSMGNMNAMFQNKQVQMQREKKEIHLKYKRQKGAKQRTDFSR